MFVFRKIWRALFSWNTHLEIHPFALLLWKTCKFPNTFSFEISRTCKLSKCYYMLASALKCGKNRRMLNPFLVTGLFLRPLKTSENLWFSCVFRVYRKRPEVFAFLRSFLKILRTTVNSFKLSICSTSHRNQSNNMHSVWLVALVINDLIRTLYVGCTISYFISSYCKLIFSSSVAFCYCCCYNLIHFIYNWQFG